MFYKYIRTLFFINIASVQGIIHKSVHPFNLHVNYNSINHYSYSIIITNSMVLLRGGCVPKFIRLIICISIPFYYETWEVSQKMYTRILIMSS